MNMFTYRDTGTWKQIICFFRDHIWEYRKSVLHYDSSTTYYYVCKRCDKWGSQ
jgi:hypothetical protein